MGTKRYSKQPVEAKIPLWFRARDYDDEALGFIVATMRDVDQPRGMRLSCAESLLDRGWGRAPILVNSETRVEHTLALGELTPAATAQLESLVMALVAPQLSHAQTKTPAIADRGLGVGAIEAEFSEVAEDAAKDGDD